jgi:hypothetical protein
MAVHHSTISVSLPDEVPVSVASLLPTALALVERHFPGARQIEGVMGWDPELEDVGSEWLELRLRVEGSVEETLAADNAFTRDWIAAVPYPAYLLIHLSFDFI